MPAQPPAVTPWAEGRLGRRTTPAQSPPSQSLDATPWAEGRLGRRTTPAQSPTSQSLAATPWAGGRLGRRGGGLLFGRMYEDPAVELAAFPPGSSILCIASAGDSAMALAVAGHCVTAIDINPAQVAYVERRLAGQPAQAGRADGMLAAGRFVLRGAGWTRRRLELLSATSDCDAQVAAWQRLTTGLPGAALRVLLTPAALRLGYQPAFAHTAAGLRHDLAARMGRGLAAHPNRDNPWAQLLFTGRWPGAFDPAPPPADRVALLVGDVATHLEGVPRGTYGGFTLSNVLDGAPESYRRRLVAAVQRAAAPGAVVVLRTFRTAANQAESRNAARDRALIWGALRICTAEELS